ncbi:MAG: hypothetical protein U0P46_14280 [Holophagaceae bacterium]
MSDVRVREAVEQMEAWLEDPAWQPDLETLTRWEDAFRVAVAQAEKNLGWPELVQRAHEAGRRLDERSEAMAAELGQLKVRLQAQDQGNRALKGYGASSR